MLTQYVSSIILTMFLQKIHSINKKKEVKILKKRHLSIRSGINIFHNSDKQFRNAGIFVCFNSRTE